MRVRVIGVTGKKLMSTTPRKARVLLTAGKAVVVMKRPFTIQLLYKTGGSTEQLYVGTDTGECHIGIALMQDDKVLEKKDYHLRSSMEKRVLLEARKNYRRGRRYRKTPYRHPKFRFHTKRVYGYDAKKNKVCWHKVSNTVLSNRPDGWLPPTIESKVKHHVDIIQRELDTLPEGTKLVIEVGRFDVQRMKDPTIHNELYQQGRMADYENVKAYVLAKYNYTCPVCKHKFDNEHKARMHHSSYKSKGATNNPDEYIPVCENCHTAENHRPGGVLDQLREKTKRKEYREPTFMNILASRLRKAFPNALFTYGNVTRADREVLGLEKTHANDAVAIAYAGRELPKHIHDCDSVVYLKQVRKKKRSLHEATPRKGRKEPNRLAKRNSKNTKSMKSLCLFDKVRTNEGGIGYVSGFSSSGVYLKNFEGKYITAGLKKQKIHAVSKIHKLTSNNNWLIGEKCNSPHHL